MLKTVLNIQTNQVLFQKRYCKKNLVLVYEIKPILTLANPTNVWSSISDLSTFLMYKSH